MIAEIFSKDSYVAYAFRQNPSGKFGELLHSKRNRANRTKNAPKRFETSGGIAQKLHTAR